MSVIPEISYDSSRVKNTFVRSEVITPEIYNELNKLAITLSNNNNLLDKNAVLVREQLNTSSKDLNNAIHQGVYSFTSEALNIPSLSVGGNLLVTNTEKIEQGNSTISQISFCDDNCIYIRTKKKQENFTSWKQISFLDSPSFIGSPTVPTPAEQDNSKKITNTEWVQAWVKTFVAKLSNNIEVETQEDGHFSCPALGITGLMAQNGYICLGKLFGNLILQWGYPTNAGEIKYPITFNKKCFCVISTDSQNKGQTPIAMGVNNLLNNNFYAIPTNAGAFFYMAIGI